MYKFTRNFFIIGLLSTVSAASLLGYVYQKSTLAHLKTLMEKENADLTHHFINTHWKVLSPWLTELQTLKTFELVQHEAIKDFGIEIRSDYNGLDILNVKVYALNGNTIFSTEQRQFGMANDADPDFKRARSGQTITRLKHRDVVNSLDSMLLDRSTLTSLTPVLAQGAGAVEAVMEMQVDISDIMADYENNKTRAFVFITIVLLSILFALFAVVRKAGILLVKHEDEIRQQLQKIEHQEYHDFLTDLPNRDLFYRQLQKGMKDVEKNEKLLAVLYLELGRFKKVNDTLGFFVGDRLLLEASMRLKQCVGNNDVVSRMGGYDFVIMLKSVSDIDEVEQVTEVIIKEISAQFEIEGYDLYLSPSIGISIHPFVDDDADGMIKKANAAMYKAKNSGRNNYLFYSPTISQKASSRFSLETSLRNALEREEFELHYQPVVLTKTGKIFAVEALIRWRSPELGLVPPNDFIPMLEDTGLIVPVGRWVLETACKQGVKWHKQGITDLKVNVNVSAVQFLKREITRQVSDALALSGIKPHLLDLEITESLLIDNINDTIETLEILNDYGVSVSVDDFGTGYSSLEYLKRLPVDTLKIDRSFISDVVDSVDDAAIVNAICAMARSMRFKTIAEGIETPEQLNYLRELDVTGIQGYLFCRPLPAAELDDFLMQDALRHYQGPAA